jgi:hypothetical protein
MISGIKATYKAVRSANGPAQMLTYSFWGILMAGMFSGVCDMCITPNMLFVWGTLSFLVAPTTIWFNKTWLKNLLLADVVMSAWILVIFLMHEPHTVTPVYYSYGVNGLTQAARPSNMVHNVSEWFHLASLIFLTLHAVYLADLTNRQILERKRFQK